MKDFTGRIISFEKSGKNCKTIGEIKYGENCGYFSFLSQGFISSLRSFLNLLKSLLNFDAPNPETLSAIREQRPSD